METEEQKEAYIAKYFQHEGIRLDMDEITWNPGLRQTAKIILNSFWGKFGQRTNLGSSKICTSSKDLFALIFDDQYEIRDFVTSPTNMKSVEILYADKDGVSMDPKNTNVYLACFTTCWARLRLHDILHPLAKLVLYYDTDSVIYKHPPGDPTVGGQIKLGDFLGDLTDELGGDRHIVEFVSTGPKSYSYRDNLGNVVCKFKGIRKNFESIQKVNLESMLECIEEGVVDPKIIMVDNLVFKLNRLGQVETEYKSKTFKMVYTKRYITENYETRPFGY